MKVEELKIIKCFSEQVFIPVIREEEPQKIIDQADRLQKNSFEVIEIAYFEALELNLLEQIKKRFPKICLGIASIQKVSQLEKLKEIADFFTSAFVSQTLLDTAKENDIRLIPGAYTASEIFQIRQTLGDFNPIKLFPMTEINYFARIRSVFPRQNFILSGVVFDQLEELFSLGVLAFFSTRLFREENFSISEISRLKNKLKSLNKK